MLDMKQIKVVDLTRSDWDKTKSDRKKGKYVFTGKKTYIIDKNYKAASLRPDHKLKWCTVTPGMMLCKAWELNYNFSYVMYNDPYWPEPIEPNADGHYVYGDAILMKCPIADYAAKVQRERLASAKAVVGTKQKFKNDTKRTDMGDASLSDGRAEDLLGIDSV